MAATLSVLFVLGRGCEPSNTVTPAGGVKPGGGVMVEPLAPPAASPAAMTLPAHSLKQSSPATFRQVGCQTCLLDIRHGVCLCVCLKNKLHPICMTLRFGMSGLYSRAFVVCMTANTKPSV